MYFTLLDLVRFVSAVGVFFCHTFLFHYGKLGVYSFFIISGFVIYFSLHKGIKDYIIGRFLRLYPIFWICATITFLITVIYGKSIDFKYYLAGLLMFNSGRMGNMIDGSYWTLTFELLFYLYIGIFVWLFGKKKLEWFYITWLFISFMSFYLKIDQVFAIKLLSVRFAPYFVFGGMLALFIDRHKVSSLKTKILYSLTLVSSALMPIYVSEKLLAQKDTISNFTGSFDPSELFIVESFFIVIPIVIFLSYLPFARKENVKKICFILGGITYPLYLLHWKIGDTIISHYGYHYGTVNVFSVCVAGAIFILATTLSLYDFKIRTFLKKKLFV